MIFSSVFFIFVFLPVALVLYYVVPHQFKNVVLLFLSLVFYAWGEPIYVFLMLFSIVFNYFSGLQIADFKAQEDAYRARFSFWFTVIINLAILGFF